MPQTKNRGMFGTSIMPGDQPPFPMERPMPQTAPQEKKAWLDGGKFTAKDAIALALGALGPGLSGRANTSQMILGLLNQRRAGEQRQQQRQMDWEDWTRKYEYERSNPKPSNAQPYRWEDNAGNVWQYGAGGQPERIFTDVVPKYYVQGDQAVQIANPYLNQSAPTKPVGRLTPIEPTMQNTPAPQTGANGFPSVLSPQQYQATVNAMGKEKTDAWMQRNGIRMGN